MSDIIRTWPAVTDPKVVPQMFREQPRWCRYYFTLGRGKPNAGIEAPLLK